MQVRGHTSSGKRLPSHLLPPCYFYKLPPELRLGIYKLIIAQIDYRNFARPALLNTSKQIRAEMSKPYRKALIEAVSQASSDVEVAEKALATLGANFELDSQTRNSIDVTPIFEARYSLEDRQDELEAVTKIEQKEKKWLASHI